MKNYPNWKRVNKSKYNNIITIVDGIKFDSRKEANRYHELKLLLKAGEISDLKLQPDFPIYVNRIKVFKYIADFSYIKGEELIVEDVKPWVTGGVIQQENLNKFKKTQAYAMYRLKKKCFEAEYPELSLREI